ncbi:hypothetical protein OG948_38005 (plasmid) [Embleya sp. NBC_00888]|uniref:hypothetical protein n=1 Tax=Embleya sp. NBC_00888 TaxID=2975960 RepID=UPI002F9067A5|nr:hypothetical protein OG948_38005 [Embleya sp. NBC_00888]
MTGGCRRTEETPRRRARLLPLLATAPESTAHSTGLPEAPAIAVAEPRRCDFPEPIALIKALDAELRGDRSFENLKKHQTSLIRTRDLINTWMQGHPDYYR